MHSVHRRTDLPPHTPKSNSYFSLRNETEIPNKKSLFQFKKAYFSTFDQKGTPPPRAYRIISRIGTMIDDRAIFV